MRYLSTIAIIFLVIQCSSQEALVVDRSDASLQQAGKYLLYHGRHFTGVVMEKFENGRIKSRAEYKDGLNEGKVRTWYDNGNPESVRIYSKGEKDGLHRGWWANGNSQFEYGFSNGAYDGSFLEWYENGKPLHHFVYDLGREVSAIGWRDNGRTYINFVVRNGKKYGLTNARLCYTLKDEKGVYPSSNQ